MSLKDSILQLKKKTGAVILAHNYVDGDIQDVADYCGDSLELSIKARDAKAKLMICCGVRFMAETAKLLSPDSTVILPNSDAGCPMADMADPEAVDAMRKEHPDAVFVAYVNTTAATKAKVDICCTSGNAEKILRSIPEDKEIVFLPDRNLGANMCRKLGREMILWNGCCPVHDRVTLADVEHSRSLHPGAIVLAHPECRPEVTDEVYASLSTAGILKFVRESRAPGFIIGTEQGILHRLRKFHDKKTYPLEPEIVCEDMKKITLEDVMEALLGNREEIKLDPEIMKAAVRPIERMLAL